MSLLPAEVRERMIYRSMKPERLRMPLIRRGGVDADAVSGGIKSDSVDATSARRIAEAGKAGFALETSSGVQFLLRSAFSERSYFGDS